MLLACSSLGRRSSPALSLSDLSLVWLLLTGCSLMSTAAAETARGNTAVSRKTPLGPHVSIRDPEKYADATPPSAADAQHSDCKEPAVLCTRQTRLHGSSAMAGPSLSSDRCVLAESHCMHKLLMIQQVCYCVLFVVMIMTMITAQSEEGNHVA